MRLIVLHISTDTTERHLINSSDVQVALYPTNKPVHTAPELRSAVTSAKTRDGAATYTSQAEYSGLRVRSVTYCTTAASGSGVEFALHIEFDYPR